MEQTTDTPKTRRKVELIGTSQNAGHASVASQRQENDNNNTSIATECPTMASNNFYYSNSLPYSNGITNSSNNNNNGTMAPAPTSGPPARMTTATTTSGPSTNQQRSCKKRPPAGATTPDYQPPPRALASRPSTLSSHASMARLFQPSPARSTTSTGSRGKYDGNWSVDFCLGLKDAASNPTERPMPRARTAAANRNSNVEDTAGADVGGGSFARLLDAKDKRQHDERMLLTEINVELVKANENKDRRQHEERMAWLSIILNRQTGAVGNGHIAAIPLPVTSSLVADPHQPSLPHPTGTQAPEAARANPVVPDQIVQTDNWGIIAEYGGIETLCVQLYSLFTSGRLGSEEAKALLDRSLAFATSDTTERSMPPAAANNNSNVTDAGGGSFARLLDAKDKRQHDERMLLTEINVELVKTNENKDRRQHEERMAWLSIIQNQQTGEVLNIPPGESAVSGVNGSIAAVPLPVTSSLVAAPHQPSLPHPTGTQAPEKVRPR